MGRRWSRLTGSTGQRQVPDDGPSINEKRPRTRPGIQSMHMASLHLPCGRTRCYPLSPFQSRMGPLSSSEAETRQDADG